MTERIYFSWQEAPYIFSWIKGVKTINIFDKSQEGIGTNDPPTAIDSISFDHHKSRTDKRRAQTVIIQYLKDKGIIVERINH